MESPASSAVSTAACAERKTTAQRSEATVASNSTPQDRRPRIVPRHRPEPPPPPSKWGGVKPEALSPKIPRLEIHPPGGESLGGTDEDSTVVEVPHSNVSTPTAILKPSNFEEDDDDYDTQDSRTIPGSVVEVLPPSSTLPTTPGLQSRIRGRKLAVVLRIEFDPACLNLSYADKARLAGLTAPDDYQLVRKYKRILDSAEFVGKRRISLQAFEAEMDVGTAVCLAEAAKRDPNLAAIRRRLRQWDERRMISGDQRDQFARLMAFLHGETDTLTTSTKGNGGNGDVPRQETDGQDLTSTGLSVQDYTESDGLVPARGAQPDWYGEGESGEE